MRASNFAVFAFVVFGTALSLACEEYGDEFDGFQDEMYGVTKTVTYQAEDHSFQSKCTEMSNNPGYTGKSFMDYGSNGSLVEWNNVSAPSAGQYTLVFRYANGSGGNRQCVITVNDTTNAGNVAFEKTGSWTTWKTSSIKVTLKRGNNKIRVTANTGSGGPNLDKMDLVYEEDSGGGTDRCALVNENSTASLSCPTGQVIESIDFASYGLPAGSCPSFQTGSCHASVTKTKVESLCLDRQSCRVDAKNTVFGDPCAGKFKKLAVVYTCDGETTGLAAKDFIGHYERTPVLNNWHKVDITLESNALRWKNAAGVTWSLSYANGVLKTGPDCPYGVKVIEVEKQSGSNPVKSLKFGADSYYKTSGVVDACPSDPNKTEPGICGCGTPDTDSDHDGTADCKDNCPSDPGKTQPGECGCGVPEGTCNSEKITHVGTTQVWDSNGQNINIARPSKSRSGDLLILVLHRTDDDLPLYVDGWTRVAECYKKDNGYDCSTEEDCTSWHNDDFCGTFGDHGGHDLAQAVFFKKVGSVEPTSYRFNLNRDSSGHPGWIILTALRGANTSDPVRDWAYKGCDGVEDSLFPSVYGRAGDMVLLSQSFDDAVAKSKFNAPDNTSTFGYVSNSDEAGFLFGGTLSSTGETGTMKTHGDGASRCKDALVSLTIKSQ